MKETKDTAANKTEAAKPESAKTVTIFLPREGIGDALEGCLNGVNFRIPTERSVEVPARIAALIRESRRTILEGSRAVQAYQALGGKQLG